MPYNSETETFYQAPATVVDSTPDGDTVQEGFDDRLTPAMAGVYTDLNLLKENGMIGVGIPATTTSRGIGRVATLADMDPGAVVENGPAFLDAATWKVSATPAAGIIPLADTDGTLNSWAGARFSVCATAAATAAKVADIVNFQLVKGARVFVTFSNANTVAGEITLNVNSTGAKNVYNERGAVSSSNIATWLTGVPIEFVYDGTNWRYKTVDAVGNAIGQYFYARDEKPSGTDGGTSAGSAWQTRELNTTKVNRIPGASLSSNRITLPPGAYRISAVSPVYGVGLTRIGIYNTTSSQYLCIGNSDKSHTYEPHLLALDSEFMLSTQAQIELRVYTQNAVSPYGLGFATSLGVNELYSEVWIWKV